MVAKSRSTSGKSTKKGTTTKASAKTSATKKTASKVAKSKKTSTTKSTAQKTKSVSTSKKKVATATATKKVAPKAKPTVKKSASASKVAPGKKASEKKVTEQKTPIKKAPVVKASAKKATTPKAVPAKSPTEKKPALVKNPVKKDQAPKVAVKTPEPVTLVKSTPKTVERSKMEAAPTRPSLSSTVLGFIGIKPYVEKRGEEYMNEAQRQHFINILAAWKASLMEEVDRTVSHMKDEAANFPDPNDRASQEEEFSLELRTRDRERKLIKKIEEATEAIKRNDYGYCEACGIDIGIRRLEARPTATLCIDCKTLAEIKEKQTVG